MDWLILLSISSYALFSVSAASMSQTIGDDGLTCGVPSFDLPILLVSPPHKMLKERGWRKCLTQRRTCGSPLASRRRLRTRFFLYVLKADTMSFPRRVTLPSWAMALFASESLHII